MIYLNAHLHPLIYKMAIFTELAKFWRIPQSALVGQALGGVGSRLPLRDTLLGSNKPFGQASRLWSGRQGDFRFCHVGSESLGMRVKSKVTRSCF